ncbi:MAG TPA: bacterial transcriptional activator domain-containing protein [Herpetosiphonaceae bacterium]|nr:bacterial transcriptional activator domain-containing protein [Herpetosiphonaceae bacterium]
MQQVIRVFHRLLPDFVEQVSAQIVDRHIPVYEALPRPQVESALYNAIRSLGVDLAQGTTTAYAEYWRMVALPRARQGISPVHSMLVTNLSTNVMTSHFKYALPEQPQALAWWLERMHTIISLGMLVMTEARIDALRQIGQLPADLPPGHALLPGAAPPRPGAAQMVPAASGITIIDSAWIAAEPLRIQTLGQARAWRGAAEITAWGRKSALALLSILITWRDQWLQREQISELLWPESDPDTAETQFKVALNALATTLEPDRRPRAGSRYIERRGTAYRLDTSAPGLHLDVIRFERLLERAADTADTAAAAELYRDALALYQGDYLADCLYSDWAAAPRERLRNQFLDAAGRLAGLALDAGDPAEARRWAEAVLERDACWEPAYRVLLRAAALEGNRALVRRTFQRCADTLRRELGLDPLPETGAAYEEALWRSS